MGKTRADILKKLDEVIQYLIKYPDSKPKSGFGENTAKLITLKENLANEFSGNHEKATQCYESDKIIVPVDEFWVTITPEVREYLAMRYFKTTRCLLTEDQKTKIAQMEIKFMSE